jgi:AcrR family transcriptional regulator
MAGERRIMRRAVSEAEKEQRREEILSAAKQVFSEQGYHATTIADVARAAELSYGSIYWYFDSKDALFLALMESEEAALRRSIAEAGLEANGSREDPLAGVRAAVRATFEFFEADRAAVRLLFRDSLTLGGAFERHLFAIHGRFMADLEKVILDAQQHGALIDGPPRLMAFCIAGLVGQVAHRRLVTDDGLDAAAAADFVVDLLFDGLRRSRP